MTKFATLAYITGVLLDDATSPELLRETLDIYRDLLLTASDLDLGGEDSLDHLDTGKGVAIGATWAALCVDDLIRTKRFVAGLYQAVREISAQRLGPVHVFYAGTGPFATLALPLMTRFTAEQLQFTCLEINPVSFHAVQETFGYFGFGEFVREVVQTDASTYCLDRHLPIDIMLSETMQYCLLEEMQVPIALNLMGQLPASTIMIPERITLSLCEVEDTADQPVTADLGVIFCADKKSLREYGAHGMGIDFPTTRFEIWPGFTTAVQPLSKLLAIRTHIHIYGDHRLADYESGLTIPSIIGRFPEDDVDEQVEAIDFTYRLSPSPQLNVEFVVSTLA